MVGASLLLVATVALASDQPRWPSFRGANAQGTAPEASLPTTWNVETGDNVLWRAEIPGLGHSSPVVWGDRVFVTTAVRADGEDADLRVGLYGDIRPVDDATPHEWLVLAFDLQSGKELWRRTAHRGAPKVKRHTKASHANASPVTDGERVIALFGSEGLHAYTVEGEELWKRDLGVLDAGFFRVPDAQWGYASSPVLHDGRVFVQADVQGQSFVAAFDAETGEELWRTLRDEVPTWSTPTIAPHAKHGEQLVLNGWKHIGGYRLDTGAEIWRMEGGGDIPVPTPVVAGDLVLITSAHGPEAPIYAISTAAEGEIEGTDSLVWEKERAGNYMQTPIVVGDIAYFCRDNGVIAAYDVSSGELHFKERLGAGSSGFSGSPVAADGKLYYGSEEGEVYVLRHGEEFEQLAVNSLGELFMSTPAIAGDRLLFRARQHLIAIGKRPAATP